MSCGLYRTLGAADATPRLQTIAPGQDRVHFVKDAAEQPGCPNEHRRLRGEALSGGE